MIGLRPARPEDATALAEVNVAAWHQAYAGRVPAEMTALVTVERRGALWQALLTEHAAKFKAFAAVDEEGDRLVGVVLVGPAINAVGGDEESDDSVDAEIHLLAVDPLYQRRDLGRRLFYAAAEHLLAEGRSRAITTFLDSAKARAFYRAMGGIEGSGVPVPGLPLSQYLFAWPDLSRLPAQPGS